MPWTQSTRTASQVLLFTPPSGSLTLSTTWPTSIPAGVSGVMQIVVNDPAALGGLSLTNGVAFVTP